MFPTCGRVAGEGLTSGDTWPVSVWVAHSCGQLSPSLAVPLTSSSLQEAMEGAPS